MTTQDGYACLYSGGRFRPVTGPAVALIDRGFTLGDGVFETLRVAAGRPLLLGAHLERLRRGAAVLRLTLPAADDVLARALQDALRAAPPRDAVVRVTVSRGPAVGRGLLPGDAGPPTVALHVAPLDAAGAVLDQGARLMIATVRRNEGSPLARIKSCNYLDNVLARQEAHAAGADDALLLNNRGEVACASAANIFWVDAAGTLVTPPLSCGVLDGITRALIMRLAARAGVRCAEQAVGAAALRDAACEVFLTNSVVGVRPVVALAGRPIGAGRPAPLTQRLADLYRAELSLQPAPPPWPLARVFPGVAHGRGRIVSNRDVDVCHLVDALRVPLCSIVRYGMPREICRPPPMAP